MIHSRWRLTSGLEWLHSEYFTEIDPCDLPTAELSSPPFSSPTQGSSLLSPRSANRLRELKAAAARRRPHPCDLLAPSTWPASPPRSTQVRSHFTPASFTTPLPLMSPSLSLSFFFLFFSLVHAERPLIEDVSQGPRRKPEDCALARGVWAWK